MDQTFFAAMTDVVTADAVRLSGRSFADAHGTAVARRVRTRRTVRAVGMGGASAVAVGAVTVGATQVPWSAAFAPEADPNAVTNPFQCGFVFPANDQRTENLWIVDAQAATVDEVNARIAERWGDNGPRATGDSSVFTVTVADVFGRSLSANAKTVVDLVDPTTVERPSPASGVEVLNGTTFVAVVNDTVVGTIADPSGPAEAPPIYRDGPVSMEQTQFTLLNPASAFTACPGASLGDDWVPYVVTADVALDSAGIVYGPEYAWRKLSGS